VSEHLDPGVQALLREVMEDEYPVLLDTFLSDSEARLNALGLAHDARDAEALRRAASCAASSKSWAAPVT